MGRATGVSRRGFLAAGSATFLGSQLAAGPQPQNDDGPPDPARIPRVAAINSVYRFKSHAYHIAGRFVTGYTKDGFHHQPPFQLVRMFNDQYPENDLSRGFCKKHGIELCDSVAAALGGRDSLDVDAVLLIIEHGDYPVNEYGQVLYPRHSYFEQIVEVFRASGRSVPVFCDKHLSYDHRLAAQMVKTAREHDFGLMAGSSLPVTWRRPEIEPPVDTPFREGLVVFGYDRNLPEIYLFHALETLQSMLERRSGGETGVKSVVGLEGDAVWRAAEEGRWSWKLMQSALARCPSHNVGTVRDNVTNPMAILIEYNDGTRGAVLNLIEQVSDFGFAGWVAGRDDPISTNFYLPAPPGARFFDPLTWNIEQHFATGVPPYPVERTLLTSTVLDFAMHSFHEGGTVKRDPALDVHYATPERTGFFRGPIADAG